MPVELVAIDLDGTLLNGKSELSQGSLEALKKAIRKGVKIILATGRLHLMAQSTIRAIGACVPIIACNGAYICDERKVYKSIFMDNRQFTDCMQFIKQRGLKCFVYTDRNIFLAHRSVDSYLIANWRKECANIGEVLKFLKNTDEILETVHDNVLKVLIQEEDADKLLILKDQLLAEGYSVVRPEQDNLEITPEGVDKGKAFEYLAKYYNIPMENTMAIGNSENDISMFRCAGKSVAMDNAYDAIKQLADFVTADNEHDGVARAIEKFVL